MYSETFQLHQATSSVTLISCRDLIQRGTQTVPLPILKSPHLPFSQDTLVLFYLQSFLKRINTNFIQKCPAAFWQMFKVQNKTFLLDLLSASYAMTICPTELISNRIAFTDRMVIFITLNMNVSVLWIDHYCNVTSISFCN